MVEYRWPQRRRCHFVAITGVVRHVLESGHPDPLLADRTGAFGEKTDIHDWPPTGFVAGVGAGEALVHPAQHARQETIVLAPVAGSEALTALATGATTHRIVEAGATGPPGHATPAVSYPQHTLHPIYRRKLSVATSRADIQIDNSKNHQSHELRKALVTILMD